MPISGPKVVPAPPSSTQSSGRIEYWFNEPRLCASEDDYIGSRDGSLDTEYGLDHRAAKHFESTAITEVVFTDDPSVRPGWALGGEPKGDTVRFKGVGRWTAEYVLLRGFGHAHAIPAGDGGLRRIIGRDYGLGRLASEAEVREIASRWGRWSGYAAIYLWFMLQLEARGQG